MYSGKIAVPPGGGGIRKIEIKKIGFVYDKRVILESFDIIPIGY
jgi:hypothetical protein